MKAIAIGAVMALLLTVGVLFIFMAIHDIREAKETCQDAKKDRPNHARWHKYQDKLLRLSLKDPIIILLVGTFSIASAASIALATAIMGSQ